MKITIDIPDKILKLLEKDAEELDMDLEEYLLFGIENLWVCK